MQYSSVASGDISIISLSGFSLTSDTLQPPAPLSKMGEILVELPAYANQTNINYGCVCVEGTPLNNPSLAKGQLVIPPDNPRIRQDFNRSRNKVCAGLTPGAKYFIYVYAINTTGVSPLSKPVSIWCN